MVKMLKVLKGEIVDYASLIENMIDKSIEGLTDKNKEILVSVIEEDEPSANGREIKIEELCVELIAQFQPKAKDLRIVLMILKMNNDLERIGDHAVNIAESSLFLIERQPIRLEVDLQGLAGETTKMLNDSINAFINKNTQKAKGVCKRDNIVDALRDEILMKFIECMIEDPATIERLMHLIRITKNLERIADLSTNICEDVIYMVEGRIIKHHLENNQDLR